MLKHLSLPIFLLILSTLCFIINALGFVFVSQIANFITISIIIALTVKDFLRDRAAMDDYLKTLYMILPIIAIVFMVGTSLATNTHHFSRALMLTIAFLCSLILFLRTDKGAEKYVLCGLYALISLPIFFILFLSFLIIPGGVETDRTSMPSPNGVHFVTAIQRSEGALGGNTNVFIERQDDNINVLIGEIRRRTRPVHSGRYSDFFLIEGFRWDGDYRLYMYRNPDRHRSIGGDVYVFELINGRWIRERIDK